MKLTRNTPILRRATLALAFALTAPSALLAAEPIQDEHAAHHVEPTQAASAAQPGLGRMQGKPESAGAKQSMPMDGSSTKDMKGMMNGMDHGSAAEGQKGMGMMGPGMHGGEAGHGPMMDMGKSQTKPGNPAEH
ncbi:hypothetical protein GALL_280690 [mine drainage metagenome]|uniref:Uncharacterized protein n=1 Tax=mine drainage metagenome TaxID=410659 RepID=A0A1J5R234_9ZZZZ